MMNKSNYVFTDFDQLQVTFFVLFNVQLNQMILHISCIVYIIFFQREKFIFDKTN